MSAGGGVKRLADGVPKLSRPSAQSLTSLNADFFFMRNEFASLHIIYKYVIDIYGAIRTLCATIHAFVLVDRTFKPIQKLLFRVMLWQILLENSRFLIYDIFDIF